MLAHTCMPFYVFDRLGGDETVSGTIAAMMSLGYMIVCLAAAEPLRRSPNAIRLAAIGSGAFAIAITVACFMTNLFLFGLFATIGFSAVALSWPALHAWLGGEPNLGKRARLMAAFNITWSAGMALGSLFAGPFYDADFRLPFLLAAVFGIFGFLLLYWQPHERDYFGEQPEDESDAVVQTSRSEYLLPASWLAIFLGFGIMGAIRSVYPRRLDTLVEEGRLVLFIGGESSEAMLAYGAATLFSVLAFAITFTSAIVYFVMGRTSAWHHRFSLVVALQLLTAGACWVLSGTNSLAVMYACYTVAGANTYVSFFTGIFYSVSKPAKKHRRAAFNESLVGAGGFAGALVAGWVAGITTLESTFAWIPAVILGIVGIELVLIRPGRSRKYTGTE